MRVRFYRPESRVYTATVEPVNADRQVLRPQDGETDVRFFRRVVLEAFDSEPGSVTIPTIPAMRITDLARAFDEDAEFEYIGVQPGEKIAEALDIGVTSDKARMLTIEEIRGLIDATV